MMATGAAVIALPAGIALACPARRFTGLVRKALFYGRADSRDPAHLRDFLDVVSPAAHHRGDLPGALTVTLALARFTAATVMHSVLAGLSALPTGQFEAALSQGFSTQQTLWRVLLPQALGNILPSLVGIFISLLKDTSLAFIVNVPELTTVAGQVNNRVQIYPAAILSLRAWSITCSAARLSSLRSAGALSGQRFNHRFHRFGCQCTAFHALVRQRGTQNTGNDNMLWLLP